MKMAKERIQQRFLGLMVRRAGPIHLIVEENHLVGSGLSKLGADALSEAIRGMAYFCEVHNDGRAYYLVVTRERLTHEQRKEITG